MDQRAFATAGGPEDQPKGERGLSVGRLDSRLPEPNDFGQVRRGLAGRASARGKMDSSSGENDRSPLGTTLASR